MDNKYLHGNYQIGLNFSQINNIVAVLTKSLWPVSPHSVKLMI